MPTDPSIRVSLRISAASRVVIADLPPAQSLRISLDADGFPIVTEAGEPVPGGGGGSGGGDAPADTFAEDGDF